MPEHKTFDGLLFNMLAIAVIPIPERRSPVVTAKYNMCRAALGLQPGDFILLKAEKRDHAWLQLVVIGPGERVFFRANNIAGIYRVISKAKV